MKRALTISTLLAVTALAALAEQKGAKASKVLPAAPREAVPPPRAAVQAAAEDTRKSALPGAPRPGVGGARLNNPLNPFQRFLQMTPEEQERLMEKANPQQQERLRQAIERYNGLRPAQREFLFRQYQILNALPPAKQVLISRQIAYFNNKLPDDRRRLVGEELIRLHRMSPADRAARMAGDDFKSTFSAEEQQVLKDLSENLPAEYPLRR